MQHPAESVSDLGEASEDSWDEAEENRQGRIRRLQQAQRVKLEAKRQMADLHEYRKGRQDCLSGCGTPVIENSGESESHAHRWRAPQPSLCSAESAAEQWRLHELRWKALEQEASLQQMDMHAVPWPPHHEDILAGMAVARHTAHRKGIGSSATGSISAGDLRDSFKAAALRWHPDKFLARFGELLAPEERVMVLQRVAELAQTVNQEWACCTTMHAS